MTNDDGAGAPGLHALAVALSDLGEVTVVAPDGQRSASGHAITIAHPLRLNMIERAAPYCVYALTGTPADCVKVGVSVVLQAAPDLVVSGINYGANSGANVTYSGTVSGAREGAMLGLPSIAVSLEASDHPDFAFSARVAREIARWVGSGRPGAGLLYNVNVPALPPDRIRGIRLTRHGHSRMIDAFERRLDPHHQPYYWMAWERMFHDEDPNSDGHAVYSGFVSVTPLLLEQTDRRAIEQMKAAGFEEIEGRLLLR
ncbi:MAG: 5'/3'-nucleotidase SurE [Candidatus Schekmanbacteria bacterium]|nr:5'/3'-nucleotidase SurE [Candidatus Schekmanbacteria bacterium]